MSDFQKCLDSSLVNGLRSIYKNHWSLFCDLKISCGDGETVIAPKLILAVHSDYFSALLKHEPETTTISLPQFNSASVTFVIKSLVDFNENDFDDVELGQVVRVADYFQMKELVAIVSDVIITKLTTEDLQVVLNLNQMIISPNLEKGCVSFIKANIQEIFKHQDPLLKSLPKATLLKTFSQPLNLLEDQFGRQCDIIETTEHLFYILSHILRASGRIEDLPEFLRHCFKGDYLYFIFTQDYDKVFLPLFRNKQESIREKLANIHGHILPKKLDIGVPVDFDVLNSLDLKQLVLSNCQTPGIWELTWNTMIYESDNFKKLEADKAIVFTVDAKNDAHIGFFSEKKSCPIHCSNEMYEIVIGGWANSQSVIRRGSQGSNKDLKATLNILKSNEDRSFWADAKDGLVRLGKGKVIGSDIVIQWQDNQPLDPSYVGFMTGWGSTGIWKFSESTKGKKDSKN